MKIRRLPLFLSASAFVYISNSFCVEVHAQHVHVHVQEQKAIDENNAKLPPLDVGYEGGESYALSSLRGRRRRNTSSEGTATATATATSTTSTSNDVTTADGIDSEESVGRQIILLAGPHKTGSTTMQRVAQLLASTKGYTQNDNWKWILPGSKIKNFSIRLMRPLTAYHTHKELDRKKADRAIRSYKDNIEEVWNNSNHNIILGGEKVDVIVDDDVTIGDDILDDMLSILPENYKDVTTVIIHYRAPRVEHLISVWKQCSMQKPTCDARFANLNFAEFMGDPDAAPLIMRHIDSLQMAKKFLDKGIKVSLLDIGGLANDEMNMYQYLACEIMKEPCNAESGLPLALIELSSEKISSLEIRLNEKKTDYGKINLDNTKIKAMEQILKKYDCNFRDDILHHEKLSLAHSNAFETNMNGCISTTSSSEPRQYFDREAVMRSLRQIVCGKDECQEAHAAVSLKEDKLAQRSGIRYVPKVTSKSGQQIVFMVGPHKAGSTSMQKIALQLTSTPGLLSKKWNWIAPPIGRPSAKSFAVLPNAIRFAGVHKGVHPVMPSEEAIRVFSAEIAKQWNDSSSSNTSLIMGSEEIDSLNDEQIGEMLSVMPPDYESATTIVVAYRSPRLEQLVSIWKQITQMSVDFHSLSFKAFILDDRFNNIRALDSMRLVKTFLAREEGFDVVLIDLAGMKEEGLHMYQVIACELMGEPCDSKTIEPDTIANKPKIIQSLTRNHNTRSIEGDVGATAQQLREINDVLLAYDCGFQDLLLEMNGNEKKSGRLTVLYDYSFTQNMNRCSDLPEPLDADATVAKLKSILLDLSDVS